MTIKDSKFVKINSANPLYLIFHKGNGFFEEICENKYLMLVPARKSKEIITKHEDLWNKIRNLIRSITKNWDDYDKKCTKIKFESDDDLPLNKVIETNDLAIVVGAIFLENCSYYPLVVLDKCLYKI